jgi:TRAP-type C4-dicarboxylate transport system permease small subunit
VSDSNAIIKLSERIHVVSASWVILLAVIIFIDVLGRYFFSTPLLGASEVIKNSVVSITFLQIPLAIYRGSMIRTTLIYDLMSPKIQAYLRTLMYVCGLLFFLGTAWSSIDPSIEAFAVSEYEGEGALRVPTYPVRFLIILTSFFATYAYFQLMVKDFIASRKS